MHGEPQTRPLDPHRSITIVSGLPRSGTSLMMQMLEAAGLDLVTDQVRAADDDNPRGYFELDAVRRLPNDDRFLKDVVGRVVKVVSPLLRSLPDEYDYRVIFMMRDLREVLASQRAMLARQARLPGRGSDPRSMDLPRVASNEQALEAAFAHQSKDAMAWLAGREGIRTCFVAHSLALASPVATCEHIVEFLDETGGFASDGVEDLSRASVVSRMALVVDPALHRHRLATEA